MYIIKTLELDKYHNKSRYVHCGGPIYKDLTGGVGAAEPVYCVTLYAEMESTEPDTQYPLEDILEEYLINCTDYMEERIVGDKRVFIFEVEGDDLQSIKTIASFVGKRVYNVADGDYVKLVVDEVTK